MFMAPVLCHVHILRIGAFVSFLVKCFRNYV